MKRSHRIAVTVAAAGGLAAAAGAALAEGPAQGGPGAATAQTTVDPAGQRHTLDDAVADLDQRVGALERRLAASAHPVTPPAASPSSHTTTGASGAGGRERDDGQGGDD